MIYIHYESHKGGTNNLCVATDRDTGLIATSTISKYEAVKLLRRKIERSVKQ